MTKGDLSFRLRVRVRVRVSVRVRVRNLIPTLPSL